MALLHIRRRQISYLCPIGVGWLGKMPPCTCCWCCCRCRGQNIDGSRSMCCRRRRCAMHSSDGSWYILKHLLFLFVVFSGNGYEVDSDKELEYKILRKYYKPFLTTGWTQFKPIDDALAARRWKGQRLMRDLAQGRKWVRALSRVAFFVVGSAQTGSGGPPFGLVSRLRRSEAVLWINVRPLYLIKISNTKSLCAADLNRIFNVICTSLICFPSPTR